MAPEGPSHKGPGLDAATDSAAPVFASRPVTSAYIGKAYAYRLSLAGKKPGQGRFRLIEGPDSMRLEGGVLVWSPTVEGQYPVVVAAEAAAGKPARQAFAVGVRKTLYPALAPLPASVNRGDTVTFDLRKSVYPSWAAATLTLRMDYQGDGHWDTPELPLAANLQHRWAYQTPGRYAPRLRFSAGVGDTSFLAGEVEVKSKVEAVLRLSPDTVDPGGTFSVDASASRSDHGGALVFRLDWNGDGKPDWVDSSSGKAKSKSPPSGTYRARLTARDALGEEGFAEAPLRSNHRSKINIRLPKARENMATAVAIRIEAGDADDSLRSIRYNLGGGPDGWVVATRPDSAKGPHRWMKAVTHVYGKPGDYPIEACVLAADGRETCGKAAVGIFNAPPTCDAGKDLRATLGVPADILGTGNDPDGAIVKWEWDLDGDGNYDLASKRDGKVKFTFSKPGLHALKLKVTSADGMSATDSLKVEVRKAW